MSLTLRSVRDDHADLEEVRCLFREYQKFLGVDLDFQDFKAELASLPAPYTEPQGALFLALWSDEPAGCVGIKPLGGSVCELKRLFVRPAFRGHSLGEALCQRAIEAARGSGYRAMRLDTLARLESAVRLYRKLGFVEIAPYYENPLPETVLFFERPL